MAFGAEVVVLVKVSLPSHQTTYFSHEQNNDNLRVKFNLLKERQEVAIQPQSSYKHFSVGYDNSCVKQRIFKVGDLVMRKVMLNTKEAGAKTLGPI